MGALDATIVSIALPSAQSALHISDANRQWMITAYTLAFGGLLLTGGRVADYVGRKRTFVIGLAGFATASALGGVAVNTGMLIGARALQGAFGALLAPTVLSLIATTFTLPKERAKAFAVFGAIAGGGGAAGLILGGLLTEYLNWRWCLYVNVPIAIVTATGGWYLIDGGPSGGPSGSPANGPSGSSANGHAGGQAGGPDRRPRFDVPGVILGGGGLVSVVYACAEAVGSGWRAPFVLGLLVTGAALLTAFVVVETRVAAPLLPMRILLDRNRGGAYLAVALTVAGMFGLFLFLTFYLQVVLRYSPVRAGLAFLPLSAAVLASSGGIASRLLPYVAPRTLMVPGLTVAAAAMVLLTRLGTDSGYVSYVLPAEILLGLGIGCVFVPAISTATQRIDRRDAGVASAVVNTSQQVGGSVGTALLNTVAATATTSYLAIHPRGATAGLVHGYAVAAGWGAGILLAAAILSLVLIDAGRPESG
jgi:MFS family permease